MGIVGVFLCLAGSSKVEVIPMAKSALNFTAQSKNYVEGDSEKKPTGKPSRRKTYLIDDGTCSRFEIDQVMPYVASAEILYLTHLNRDLTWTTWLPDGMLLKNVKLNPPWKNFQQASDYTPVGKTFVVWNQSKLTVKQEGVMKKGFWEDPYDGVADGVVATFNGAGFLIVDGRVNFWDEEAWGYGYGKPAEYANIPFWIETLIANPGSLAPQVGATLKIGKSILRLDSFRDPDDDVFPTRAKVTLCPACPNKAIELTPIPKRSKSEAKGGQQTDKSDIERFSSPSYGRSVKDGLQQYEASTKTAFKNWERINVKESVRMVGYFGHVKTHPNGEIFPYRMVED